MRSHTNRIFALSVIVGVLLVVGFWIYKTEAKNESRTVEVEIGGGDDAKGEGVIGPNAVVVNDDVIIKGRLGVKAGTGDFQMTVLANGVGIGTLSPSEKLEVNGNIRSTGVIDSTGMSSKIRFHYNVFGDLPSASTYHGMFAHVHGDATAYFAHAGEWLQLIHEDSSGNVGIGTASPNEKLTVVGTIESTSGGFRFPDGTVQTTAATGGFSTIPGGQSNSAAGAHSFAAGRDARISASHNGTFLFADATDNNFTSSAPNEFAVRATGGVRFVTATDGIGNPTAGVKLAPGGSSWAALSDRNVKMNFASVDGREVLERLAAVPIQTWNYKSQVSSIRHIGPMAQDFYAAFGVGGDDKHINTVDADGVAMAAIQGLYQLMQEKDAQIAAQQKTIDTLNSELTGVKAKMAQFESVLQKLEALAAVQKSGDVSAKGETQVSFSK